jgi:hypothetical protein
MSKLNQQKADEIRLKYLSSQSDDPPVEMNVFVKNMSDQYLVSERLIYRVLKNQVWKKYPVSKETEDF